MRLSLSSKTKSHQSRLKEEQTEQDILVMSKKANRIKCPKQF